MRHYGYLILMGLFFLMGCNTSDSSKDASKGVSQSPKDNYIVLLDLSDRILFDSLQQIPKDIEVVQSIYSIFKSKLNIKDSSKKYYGITDKLKLLGAPNWFYASVDLSAEQPAKREAIPDKMEKTFNALLPEIYKGVISGTSNTEYAGADIWKYFNEHLTDDLDKEGQNTLFIVTDGYMNLNNTKEPPAQKNRYASCGQIINALKDYPDWENRFTTDDYGLLPISKKFANLRVILLQVNPKEGWNGEYSLLTKIWDKWFTEMGISNYSFIKNDSTNKVKEMLGKLMNVKIDSTTTSEQWAQITTADSSLRMDIAADKKTTDASKKTVPVTTLKELKNDNTPVTTKENDGTTAVSSTSPNLSLAKKTPAATKKNESSTPEVVPPDESDSTALNIKKISKSPVKKTGLKNNDDILEDDGAANGFNTGIKKSTKKKNN
ncbi:MAG TPA: hypothetical protein VK645_19750 [Chitinophagaceae bacterium]|nr:hypothetical protein [Chitinophagaceae bacterium]